jgi:hypothetical protein
VPVLREEFVRLNRTMGAVLGCTCSKKPKICCHIPVLQAIELGNADPDMAADIVKTNWGEFEFSEWCRYQRGPIASRGKRH